MAVFTAIDDIALSTWLTRYKLGSLVSFKGISSGIENTNYFVSTTQDEFVLTLFERLQAEQLSFYLHLMRHLALKGVAVAHPIEDTHGNLWNDLCNKPAAIVNKLRGASLITPASSDCAQVGDMLAKMHIAGKDFSQYEPNPRSLAWWQKTSHIVMPFLDAQQNQLLTTELAHQENFFASTLYAELPSGPCHCDLFRNNVMFEAGQLSGFFDFYFAGHDKWIFDIAVTANDWCIDIASGEINFSHLQSLLKAYEVIRPLTSNEKIALPNMLRAGALRFWLSRLYDFYLPRDASLLTAHEPKHFESILKQRIDFSISPTLTSTLWN